MNKLKTDYPFDLKLWLVCFFTIIFPFKNLDFMKRNDIIQKKKEK